MGLCQNRSFQASRSPSPFVCTSIGAGDLPAPLDCPPHLGLDRLPAGILAPAAVKGRRAGLTLCEGWAGVSAVARRGRRLARAVAWPCRSSGTGRATRAGLSQGKSARPYTVISIRHWVWLAQTGHGLGPGQSLQLKTDPGGAKATSMRSGGSPAAGRGGSGLPQGGTALDPRSIQLPRTSCGPITLSLPHGAQHLPQAPAASCCGSG